MDRPQRAPKRPVILVVDDERDILVALEDLFDDEYEVLATTSPAAALEMLAARRDVSVIISDQRMPEMPGNVLIARARAISDAQAILLTGYADMDAVIAAINEGRVANYVHKPWEPEALRSTVALAHERHRLARALDLEQSLFAGLLDGATDAIVLTDSGGRILRINAAKAAALGRPAAACIGEVLALLEDRPDPAVPADPAGAVEERMTATGEQRFVRVTRVPIDTPADGTVLLTVESDVTAERVLEQRLRQAEKLQALGTLAGGIAHDFNNLLTAVIGNLDLAERRAGHPAVPRYIESALNAARRGTSLTRRLLSFSRQREVSARAIDVNALIRGMEDLVRRTLGGVVAIEMVLDPQAGFARADPDQLELAILNLCVNARDAMPDGGRIRIETSLHEQRDPGGGLAPGEYVRIAVADNGTGMSKSVLARAFEPFFTTKEVGKGTGLGLSMTYSMAAGLGGTARIDSTVGEGTTVTLFLPRAQAPAEHDVEARDAARAHRPLRVLLVEDDASVREVTQGYLEDLGHEVLTAANAPTALGLLAAEERLDALVTDFAMPGQSGLDLVGEARQLRPGLPFLLITGYADAATIPADVARLTKPFTQAELAAAIAGLPERV